MPSAKATGAEESAPGDNHTRGAWTLACVLTAVDTVCYLLHQHEVRELPWGVTPDGLKGLYVEDHNVALVVSPQ